MGTIVGAVAQSVLVSTAGLVAGMQSPEASDWGCPLEAISFCSLAEVPLRLLACSGRVGSLSLCTGDTLLLSLMCYVAVVLGTKGNRDRDLLPLVSTGPTGPWMEGTLVLREQRCGPWYSEGSRCLSPTRLACPGYPSSMHPLCTGGSTLPPGAHGSREDRA